MRKIRSDALWHKLTPEQKKKIEHWFLDKNLSYRAVHERMRTEFGVTCALSILGPMYHHCKEIRSREREVMLDRLTEILTDRRGDLRRIPAESLEVILGCLIHRSLVKDDTKTVAFLANIMMQGNLHEVEHDRTRLAEEKLAFRRLKFAVSNGVIGSKELLVQLSDTMQKNQAHLSDTVPPKPGLSGLNRDKK